MNKNSILALAIGMLVIGGGVGYVIAMSQLPAPQSIESAQTPTGQHVMPDGTMMANTTTIAAEESDVMPMDMASMMMDMSEGLIDKTGDEFDKAFLEEMIIHHEGAVDMAQLATMNAKHQEIKDLANAIITAQEKEIASMKAWEKSWYGE